MKKLLATTAMCLVLATSLHSTIQVNEAAIAVTYDAHDFAVAAESIEVLTTEKNLYRGDFQGLVRTIPDNQLYAGIGSIKMASIQSIRA